MGKHKTASKRSEVLATSDLPSGVDRVVSEKQAAEILNLNYFTLRRLFAAGRAPPRIRSSQARVGYRLSSLYAWLETRTEQPGADRSLDVGRQGWAARASVKRA